MLKQILLNNWKQHLLNDNITTNSRWLSTLSLRPTSVNFLIPKILFLPKPEDGLLEIKINNSCI